MSKIDRRKFLRQGSLATGAALFLQPDDAVRAAALAPLFDAADQVALQFVRSYSPNVLLHGGSVAAKLAGATPQQTSMLAEIRDLAQFSRIYSGARSAGMSDIHVDGIIATFTVSGRVFEVESLQTTDFIVRLADLQAGRNIAFAHEALTLRTSDGAQSDPMRARRSLRLVRSQSGTASALQDLFDGLVQAKNFGLAPDANFTSHERALLGTDASPAPQAQAAVAAFVQHLTPLSAALKASGIARLLESRVLTTAFATRFSVKTSGIVADFHTLRAQLGESSSDAAIWLAAILAPEIAGGTADTWIQTTSSYRTRTARAQLRHAKAVVATPAFAELQSRA